MNYQKTIPKREREQQKKAKQMNLPERVFSVYDKKIKIKIKITA